MANLEEVMRNMGTVEKVFSYGKCGFICTPRDEHFYFSPKSFSSEAKRLKPGMVVTFVASSQNGRPMATEIDAETPEFIRSAMQAYYKGKKE